MKISTKGRYAIRLMLDLAENQRDGYVALKDIAKRQGISKKYLEQIVPILNSADFLKTNRGYQGGYRLARSADKYTIYDILVATEGSLAPVACLDNDSTECERTASCATLHLWKGLYKTVKEYLSSYTLQDLLEQQQSLYSNDYVI